jgi:hypothetical protein
MSKFVGYDDPEALIRLSFQKIEDNRILDTIIVSGSTEIEGYNIRAVRGDITRGIMIKTEEKVSEHFKGSNEKLSFIIKPKLLAEILDFVRTELKANNED